MKRIIVTFLVIVGGLVNLYAQPQSIYEIPLADSIKYVLPEFGSGRVVYTDGTYANGRFNLSTWEENLLFLDDEGKVMAIADNSIVDQVVIGGQIFYHRKMEYVGVVEIVGNVILCSSRKLIFDDAVTGPYGAKSSTIASHQIGMLSDNMGNIHELIEEDNYELKDEPYIFRNNNIQTPTRKLILKAFPGKKAEIEAYLKDNQVNFSSLEDLQRLFRYIGTL